MELAKIMTTDVNFVAPTATVAAVARMMREKDIGMMPVGENNRLIGTVTDRDITLRATADGKDPEQATVRDVMSSRIAYCYEDQSIEEAAKVMGEKRIRRLPVLSRDKRLVGIVSLGDIAAKSGNPQSVGEALAALSRH